MFDTMTLTKVVGGLCGSLLIFLLGKWAAEIMYDTGGGHGYGHSAAYVIDTGEDEDTGAEAEEGPSLAEMYAAADIDKGEKVFGKCKACHKLEDGANSTGPYLLGVVGRDIGAADGFGYSGSLVAVADVWTVEALDGFLENPKKWAPGTSMAFAGLGKPADRVNVIAYLDSLDGDMTTLEMPAEDAAMEEDHSEAEMAEEEMVETAAADTTEMSEEAEMASEEGAAEEEMAATEEPAAEAEMSSTEEPAAEEEMTATEEPAAEEEMAATEEPAAEEEATPAMAMAGDPEAGEKVYRKCKACHAIEDGKNRVGPHLYAIMGREVASVDGFKYSDAMAAVGGTWTVEQMDAWLADPKGFAPGNKMSFAGLKKEDDRANIIAYLATLGN